MRINYSVTKHVQENIIATVQYTVSIIYGNLSR